MIEEKSDKSVRMAPRHRFRRYRKPSASPPKTSPWIATFVETQDAAHLAEGDFLGSASMMIAAVLSGLSAMCAGLKLFVPET
jgi:hypothetical protein